MFNAVKPVLSLEPYMARSLHGNGKGNWTGTGTDTKGNNGVFSK